VSRRLAAVTVLTVSLLLTSPPSGVARTEVSVLGHDERAEALSTVSVRLRLHHAGEDELRPCTSADSPEKPCVTLAYRWDKRPTVLSLSRVDTAILLPGNTVVSRGDTIVRDVQIPTPRRARRTTVYLYVVTHSRAGADWQESALDVEIGQPPLDVRRRIRVARGLMALYAVGTLALASIAWRRSGTTVSR
jgi:hypothetical protein